jgi:hypothetical protein
LTAVAGDLVADRSNTELGQDAFAGLGEATADGIDVGPQ